MGAVLSQVGEQGETVIAYYSKTLTPSERNYCVASRGLLAVVRAVLHFRPSLYGKRFKIRTDYASLLWLCRKTEPTCQVARWIEILLDFGYQIEHRPGRPHGIADAMSRLCGECKQCNRIEENSRGPTQEEVVDDWSKHQFPTHSINQETETLEIALFVGVVNQGKIPEQDLAASTERIPGQWERSTTS